VFDVAESAANYHASCVLVSSCSGLLSGLAVETKKITLVSNPKNCNIYIMHMIK